MHGGQASLRTWQHRHLAAGRQPGAAPLQHAPVGAGAEQQLGAAAAHEAQGDHRPDVRPAAVRPLGRRTGNARVGQRPAAAAAACSDAVQLHAAVPQPHSQHPGLGLRECHRRGATRQGQAAERRCRVGQRVERHPAGGGRSTGSRLQASVASCQQCGLCLRQGRRWGTGRVPHTAQQHTSTSYPRAGLRWKRGSVHLAALPSYLAAGETGHWQVVRRAGGPPGPQVAHRAGRRRLLRRRRQQDRGPARCQAFQSSSCSCAGARRRRLGVQDCSGGQVGLHPAQLGAQCGRQRFQLLQRGRRCSSAAGGLPDRLVGRMEVVGRCTHAAGGSRQPLSL